MWVTIDLCMSNYSLRQKQAWGDIDFTTEHESGGTKEWPGQDDVLSPTMIPSHEWR